MWKIFGTKCVKFVAFCILQSFTSANADALRIVFKPKGTCKQVTREGSYSKHQFNYITLNKKNGNTTGQKNIDQIQNVSLSNSLMD